MSNTTHDLTPAMSRGEAERIAYGLIADEIEFFIDRHGDEYADDGRLPVIAELRRLHDKFQLKADRERIIPSMRLDDLEQLGGQAATEESNPTVTRCPSTYPNWGQCWNVTGHDGKHHVGAIDDYDEDDFEWDEEQLAAAIERANDKTIRCLCGKVFDTQEALDEHAATEEEAATEEPDRTLTAVERRAAQEYIAPVGVAEASEHCEYGCTESVADAACPSHGVKEFLTSLLAEPTTDTERVSDAIDAEAAEAGAE